MTGSRNNLNAWRCTDLGLRMAVALGLCAYGGYRFDLWLHTEPFGLALGSLIGLAVGTTHVVQEATRLTARPPEDGDGDDA